MLGRMKNVVRAWKGHKIVCLACSRLTAEHRLAKVPQQQLPLYSAPCKTMNVVKCILFTQISGFVNKVCNTVWLKIAGLQKETEMADDATNEATMHWPLLCLQSWLMWLLLTHCQQQAFSSRASRLLLLSFFHPLQSDSLQHGSPAAAAQEDVAHCTTSCGHFTSLTSAPEIR